MKPIVCLPVLAVLAAVLGAASFARAQEQATGTAAAPVLVNVMGAEMSSLCHDADIERARRVSDACDGKTQCRFTPEAGTESSEACARDSVVLWNCGDGKTREAKLAPEPGESREIVMACAQPAVSVAAAMPPPASAQAAPAVKDGTETVTSESRKAGLTARPVPPPVLDASAAGVAREQARMNSEMHFDPTAVGMTGVRLKVLHDQIYSKPDHSPGGLDDCQRKGQACALTAPPP